MKFALLVSWQTRLEIEISQVEFHCSVAVRETEYLAVHLCSFDCLTYVVHRVYVPLKASIFTKNYG